jgi:hypothetical protein
MMLLTISWLTCSDKVRLDSVPKAWVASGKSDAGLSGGSSWRALTLLSLGSFGLTSLR